MGEARALTSCRIIEVPDRNMATDKQPTVIKKYANRRLYHTGTSTYVTLEDLAKMVREGEDFLVYDAKSGEDITRSVLTQIIVEEETRGQTRGQTLLPIPFLRQIIAMYGDSMQAVVPQYLEASMDAFRRNQEQFRTAMFGGGAFKPFEQIAKQNMAMFQAAAEMLTGRKPAKTGDTPSQTDEIRALKDQLAALQAQIDKLSDR